MFTHRQLDNDELEFDNNPRSEWLVGLRLLMPCTELCQFFTTTRIRKDNPGSFQGSLPKTRVLLAKVVTLISRMLWCRKKREPFEVLNKRELEGAYAAVNFIFDCGVCQRDELTHEKPTPNSIRCLI